MRREQPAGKGQRYAYLRLVAALVAAPALAGCGPDTRSSAKYDEVVARVNGEEITVHQLNERLAELGLPAGGDPGAAHRQLLDSMIDEHLLVQTAITRGLDRDLATRKAIERARRQLLAKAAIEDTSGDRKVNEKEMRAFYRANPDLFGNRKLYTFRRFLLELRNLEAKVKAELDLARTGDDVAVVLKASGIPYTQVTEFRTAESLPAVVLPLAARMAPGDILLVAEGSGTVLMQLAASVAEPVSLDAALPSIHYYLAEARHQQGAARLLKDLRRQAKVEYVIQTARTAKPTALADGKPVLGEPDAKKILQPRQTTIVR